MVCMCPYLHCSLLYGTYRMVVAVYTVFAVSYVWYVRMCIYLHCLSTYGTYYICCTGTYWYRTAYVRTVRSLRLSSRVCIQYSIHSGTCLIIQTFSIDRCLFLESLIGLLIISILKKYFKFTKQIGLSK